MMPDYAACAGCQHAIEDHTGMGCRQVVEEGNGERCPCRRFELHPLPGDAA